MYINILYIHTLAPGETDTQTETTHKEKTKTRESKEALVSNTQYSRISIDPAHPIQREDGQRESKEALISNT